jgi:hypothetical protein
MHPDDIKDLARELAILMGIIPTVPKTSPVDPAEYAIRLAKSGRIEESKQFLKSLSKRKSH